MHKYCHVDNLPIYLSVATSDFARQNDRLAMSDDGRLVMSQEQEIPQVSPFEAIRKAADDGSEYAKSIKQLRREEQKQLEQGQQPSLFDPPQK